jgi:hypothetical protein
MKKLFATLFAVAALAPFSACEVHKTQEGKLPDVDVSGGQVPKYDVDAKDVDVQVKNRAAEVTVPDVDIDVKSEKRQVTVPDIDIDVHDGVDDDAPPAPAPAY